jgi:hypothetical protein
VEEEDGVGYDLAAIRDWASYAWVAVRRHARAIAATIGAFTAAAALVRWSIPDLYYVEARVLAQRPDVLAVLSPTRPLGADAVAITRSVSDLVERRENLVALVSQTDLVKHWRSMRSWTDRLEERLGLGYELDDEQARDMLVAKLEDSIEATARDSSVALGLRWEDPEMAFRLLDVALQNLLETRHVNEMAILGESISLLEARLGEAQRSVDEAMAGVRSLPPPRRPSRGGAARRDPSLELVRMLSVIAEKRRAMEDVVSFRNRRIAELQTRLTEQRAVYAESHPVVDNIKRSLEALQADSPQLAALRQELQQDEARYLAEGGSPADFGDSSAAGTTSTPDALIDALAGAPRDPNEEYARSRMATSLARYYSVADRLEALRLQRDAARASIKYRYLVVRPPMRPHQPENRGLKGLVLAAGALLGAIAGVLAAVGLEVRRGRIDQPWQVERLLGLRILAEAPAASRPSEDALAIPAAAGRSPAPALREQERPV